MHIQGGHRGGKLANATETVFEKRTGHAYSVVSAGHHQIVLKHDRTGEESEFTKHEFRKLFERV